MRTLLEASMFVTLINAGVSNSRTAKLFNAAPRDDS